MNQVILINYGIDEFNRVEGLQPDLLHGPK